MRRKLVVTLLAMALVFGSLGIVQADTVTVPKDEEELYDVIKAIHGELGESGEAHVEEALRQLIGWYKSLGGSAQHLEVIGLVEYDDHYELYDDLNNALTSLVDHYEDNDFAGLSLVQDEVFDVLMTLAKLNGIDTESASPVELLQIKVLIATVLDNLKVAIDPLPLDNAIDALKAAFIAYIASLTPPTHDDSNTGSTGGSTIITPSDDDVDEIVEGAQNELDELLQGTQPTDNAYEAAELARKAVADAIKQAGKLQIAGGATFSGGVSQYTIDLPNIGEQFAKISENASILNELLQEAMPEANPAKAVVTFDIGTSITNAAEINLPEGLVDQAKAAGIGAIAIQVNGIAIQFDIDDLQGDSTLTVAKQESEEAADLPNASDVYQFTFQSSSSSGSFSKPVEVSIPVSVDGVDPDLLVLAKIVDGGLEFYGGMYDEATGTFQAKRKSFSSYVVVENRVSFNDTDSVKSWAGHQIDVVAAKGIIDGRGAGVFDPMANITRAEFAKMIVKAFALEDENATENFTDVNDNDWFQPYVAAAVEAGIINGRSATIFDPHANITRAEMAVMAARGLVNGLSYTEVQDPAAALAHYVDADEISAVLQSGVALSSTHGIVIGVGDGQFNPNGNSTRAQAAVLIYRLLQK